MPRNRDEYQRRRLFDLFGSKKQQAFEEFELLAEDLPPPPRRRPSMGRDERERLDPGEPRDLPPPQTHPDPLERPRREREPRREESPEARAKSKGRPANEESSGRRSEMLRWLRHEEESTHILNQVERVMRALERHDSRRRKVFLKMIAAWVVAYALTIGEVPWFLREGWTMASHLVVQWNEFFTMPSPASPPLVEPMQSAPLSVAPPPETPPLPPQAPSPSGQ
ncbi:hypothetical protein JCM17960_01240 [Magnetospira thiophila]